MKLLQLLLIAFYVFTPRSDASDQVLNNELTTLSESYASIVLYDPNSLIKKPELEQRLKKSKVKNHRLCEVDLPKNEKETVGQSTLFKQWKIYYHVNGSPTVEWNKLKEKYREYCFSSSKLLSKKKGKKLFERIYYLLKEHYLTDINYPPKWFKTAQKQSPLLKGRMFPVLTISPLTFAKSCHCKKENSEESSNVNFELPLRNRSTPQ